MTESSCLNEQLLDQIAKALHEEGFIQLTQFLPESLAAQLRQEVKFLSSTDFKPASIGRNGSLQLNARVRTDSTLWLTGESEAQSDYLDWMEQLRAGLNSRLFMGLFDFESHFSHYGKGDFYKRHLDAFKGQSNRILSTVFYLNQDWDKSDGGELLLYPDDGSSPCLRMPPLFNHCVIFLSDTFPHEVLVSGRDRYSIAGWYRLNNK